MTENEEETQDKKKPILTGVLTVILIASVAVGVFYIFESGKTQNPEDKTTFTFDFPIEDYEGMDVINQEFDEDCQYYHNNLTESERSEYRESTVQGQDVDLRTSTEGIFYQFCKPVNETTRYRSEEFAVYSQSGGAISPPEIRLWKDSNGSIEELGSISLVPSR